MSFFVKILKFRTKNKVYRTYRILDIDHQPRCIDMAWLAYLLVLLFVFPIFFSWALSLKVLSFKTPVFSAASALAAAAATPHALGAVWINPSRHGGHLEEKRRVDVDLVFLICIFFFIFFCYCFSSCFFVVVVGGGGGSVNLC